MLSRKAKFAILGLLGLGAAAGLVAVAKIKAYDYPEKYPAGYPGTSEYNRRGPAGLGGGSTGRFTQPHPGGGYWENPTQ